MSSNGAVSSNGQPAKVFSRRTGRVTTTTMKRIERALQGGLPKTKDVEHELISVLLYDQDMLPVVVEKLPSKALSDPQYKAVYESIERIYRGGGEVDLVTVTEDLKSRGRMKAAGGEAKLSTTFSFDATSRSASTYADIILQAWQKRELVRIGINMVLQGQQSNKSVEDLLQWMESQTFEVGMGIEDVRPEELGEGIETRIEDIIDGDPDEISGIRTGFAELDELTSGWQDGTTIIVAARPSMGKSAFALWQSVTAVEQGKKVLFFSYEMTKHEFQERLLSGYCRVNSNNIRHRRVTPKEAKRMRSMAERIRSMPLFYTRASGLSIERLMSMARHAVRQGKADMIVVDYLQIMYSSKDFGSAEKEIAYISRCLKLLAQELNVPVIILSQLNRKCETRSDKRPMLSDLRESGAIEQDADLVLFIYRPSQYGEVVDEKGNNIENLAELILSKQRNGPTGMVEAAFIDHYGRFQPRTDWYDDYNEQGNYVPIHERSMRDGTS